MAITAQANFNPDIKWSKGSGCLHCGGNVSTLGAKVGIQCVDLGIDDEFLGRFGLCYDCALQVALAIGFLSQHEALGVLEEARQYAERAAALEAAAAAAASQARLDRDTVERLLGSVYVEPEAEPFGPGVS